MQARPTGDLVRALLVLEACQFQPFVRNAGRLLELSRRLLGPAATAAILKPTFYAQFVAGGWCDWRGLGCRPPHGKNEGGQ
jgi:hypothetical protein